MNQQPDKFFRDKLLDYQQGVPSNAWNRVSINLQKRRRGLWLRYAASLILVAATGLAIYSSLEDQTAETHTALSGNHVLPPDRKSEQAPTPGVKQYGNVPNDSSRKGNPAPTLPGKDSAQAAPSHKPSHTTKHASEKNLSALTETTPAATERVSEKHDEETEEDASFDIKVEENVVAVTETLPEESRGGTVTIVFTAEEVNKKYLKKNAKAEATSEPKASSGLRKLLDKASDLTTNQDLLGDLRQKKNEILAMNFKSEKHRSEND